MRTTSGKAILVPSFVEPLVLRESRSKCRDIYGFALDRLREPSMFVDGASTPLYRSHRPAIGENTGVTTIANRAVRETTRPRTPGVFMARGLQIRRHPPWFPIVKGDPLCEISLSLSLVIEACGSVAILGLHPSRRFLSKVQSVMPTV